MHARGVAAAACSHCKNGCWAQMLMTRATREKLAAQRNGGAAAAKATHAVVRVRLPDGVTVQVLPGKDTTVLREPLVRLCCCCSASASGR